jgi:hypothetical protein
MTEAVDWSTRKSARCATRRRIGEHGLMAVFTRDEVLAMRMANLLLATREARSPADVVTWMGAMQAQDLASGEWSSVSAATG